MNLMETIAMVGGGRAYFTNDFYSIPPDIHARGPPRLQEHVGRTPGPAHRHQRRRSPGRNRHRRTAAPDRLCGHHPQGRRQHHPRLRLRRPPPGELALRPGPNGGVHVRDQAALGRRLARMARLRQVLEPARPQRNRREPGQRLVNSSAATPWTGPTPP